MERYKVATCSGFRTIRPSREQRGSGLSAYVLDRHNCHREVAAFNSEDQVRVYTDNGESRFGGTLGIAGALAAAEQRCAELNAADALA